MFGLVIIFLLLVLLAKKGGMVGMIFAGILVIPVAFFLLIYLVSAVM